MARARPLRVLLQVGVDWSVRSALLLAVTVLPDAAAAVAICYMPEGYLRVR